MLPVTSEGGLSSFAPHAGGAVLNTAVALGRLGIETGFASGLSSDFFGEILQKTLRESGVSAGHSAILDRPTTLAFVQIENGEASYTFLDENSAGRTVSIDSFEVFPASVTSLFFGGISLACEPCGSTYEQLLMREGANRTVMLDPNVRANFVQDEGLYRARIDRMIGLSDIVKFSDQDLEWLYGTKSPEEDIAHRIIEEHGTSLIIMTKGKVGATGYTAEHVISVPAVTTPVVDTVGAGDTFNAGVIAEFSCRQILSKSEIASLSSDDLRAALEFGARVAAVTASRSGADAPWRRELA